MMAIRKAGYLAAASVLCMSTVAHQSAEARGRGGAAAVGIIGGLIVGGIIANELSKQQQRPQQERRTYRPRPEPRESARPAPRTQPVEDDDEELANNMSMQRALTELGYSVGSPDGKVGPSTRRAISEFQRAIGVPETGRLLPSQRDELMRQATLAANPVQPRFPQAQLPPPPGGGQLGPQPVPPMRTVTAPPPPMQQPQAQPQVAQPMPLPQDPIAQQVRPQIPQQPQVADAQPQPPANPMGQPAADQQQGVNRPTSAEMADRGPAPRGRNDELAMRRTGPGSHVDMLGQLQRVMDDPAAGNVNTSSFDVSPEGEVSIKLQTIMPVADIIGARPQALELKGTPQNLLTTIDRGNDRIVHVVFHQVEELRQLVLYSVSFETARQAKEWAQSMQGEIDQLAVVAGKTDDPYADLKANRRRPQA